MNAPQLGLSRLLAPIYPFVFFLLAVNLLALDVSTHVENKLETVTFHSPGRPDVSHSTRRDMEFVDLRWRFGPFVMSTRSVSALIFVLEMEPYTPNDAIIVLRSRKQSLMALCLFPLVLACSLLIRRASHSKDPPLEKSSDPYSPLRTAGIILGVFFLSMILVVLLRPFWPVELANLSRWWGANVAGVAPLICFTVLIPIAEEVVFRAGLCRVLVDKLGRTQGIVLQALLFGALHLATPIHFAVGIGGGIALGMVYTYTRSLPAAIAVHSGANLTLAAVCTYFMTQST